MKRHEPGQRRDHGGKGDHSRWWLSTPQAKNKAVIGGQVAHWRGRGREQQRQDRWRRGCLAQHLARSQLGSYTEAGSRPWMPPALPVQPSGTLIWARLALGSGATSHVEIWVLPWLGPTSSYAYRMNADITFPYQSSFCLLLSNNPGHRKPNRYISLDPSYTFITATSCKFTRNLKKKKKRMFLS